MAQKYSEVYEVAYYDGDVNQTMTLPSLLAVMIKVSEDQSGLLGRGKEFIAQYGLSWVITNYEMSIHRLPAVGEKITITTQATSYNKFFCYRNFWVHDQQGHELVLIQTTFVLIDTVTRKMSHVLPDIIAPYDCEKVNKLRRGKKIEKITDGESLSYRVRFFDIDGNKHVNNSVYFNWMMDVLGYDFLTTYVPKKVVIKFDKEIEYGNQVESNFELIDETSGTLTLHEIRVGDQLCSEANIYWEKR